MGPIRRFSAALVIAAVMAAGLNTVGLEAKRKSGGDGGDTTQQAICSYLKAIIDYPYTNIAILTIVVWLYNDVYGCTAQ